MLWITLAIGSAIFLGLYDISKKNALQNNAVWPVLFICSFTGAVLLVPVLIFKEVPVLSCREHGLLCLKAALVTGSWAFTYNAVSRMPLSITSPIRASAPLFTIVMAISFMAERPSSMQWMGIAISLLSYVVMSVAGRRETGSYWRNPWVLAMFFGTFLGSCSGIYDKFLLQRMHFDPLALQIWFSFYMVIIQGAIMMIVWYPRCRQGPQFHFKWVMLAVGVLLLIADRFYFLALHEEDALVSVVTVIRRSNVVISFAGGILLFGEKKGKLKVLAVAGILCGLIFMGLG